MFSFKTIRYLGLGLLVFIILSLSSIYFFSAKKNYALLTTLLTKDTPVDEKLHLLNNLFVESKRSFNDYLTSKINSIDDIIIPLNRMLSELKSLEEIAEGKEQEAIQNFTNTLNNFKITIIDFNEEKNYDIAGSGASLLQQKIIIFKENILRDFSFLNNTLSEKKTGSTMLLKNIYFFQTLLSEVFSSYENFVQTDWNSLENVLIPVNRLLKESKNLKNILHGEEKELAEELIKTVKDFKLSILNYHEEVQLDTAGSTALIMRESAIRSSESTYTLMKNLSKNLEQRISTSKMTMLELGKRIQILSVIGGVVGVFFGIFIAFIMGRVLTQALLKLIEGTKKISEGDLSFRIKIKSKDEMGLLAKSFNKMGEDIQAYRDEAEASKNYIEEIIKSMTDCLIAIEPNGKILFVNKFVEKTLGYKENELAQTPFSSLFSKAGEKYNYKKITEIFKKRMWIESEEIFKTKEGKEVPMHLSGTVLTNHNSIIVIAHDLRETKKLIEKEKNYAVAIATSNEAKKKAHEIERAYKELKKVQTKLIQAGKMAALGELGTGIAHELNQPLTGILSFSRAMSQDFEKGKNQNFAKDLKVIEEQALRMSLIIKKIVAFAHPIKTETGPTDVNVVLNSSLALIEAQLKEHNIEVLNEVPADFPKVSGVNNLLQQVFLNLFTNARDSFEELSNSSSACIHIYGKSVGTDRVSIFVSDNGLSLNKEIEEHLFEPFFTTKPEGKGTGLGLSLSYGIMHDLGGELSFERGPQGEKIFVLELQAA